jgi:hypothetical protein
MRNCKSYTISMLRLCFLFYIRIRTREFVFLFTRFEDTSSDKDVLLSELARGVGKSTGDSTDDEDKLHA